MTRRAFGALTLASAATLSGVRTQAQISVGDPIVVELFTSQGCSSCPPADELLLELAERDDVIALSMPVDYWDNLGWRDTFAAAEHTDRQRGYAQRLPNRRLYTPQMVVNGRFDVVGSRRDEVYETIERLSEETSAQVNINVVNLGDRFTVRIAEAPVDLSEVRASVWMIPYHKGPLPVSIERGENRGRTISYSNVVNGIRKIGDYWGTMTALFHSLEDLQDKKVDGCVIVVQEDDNGPILAARRMLLSPTS